MNAASAKRPRRWMSWLIKAAVSFLVILALLTITAPYSLGWIIGHTLQSQLSTRMQAKLQFNQVLYQFPYGVRIDKAHLLMPSHTSGPDSWIDIGRLELKLAKLPIGIGPLVIERLEIENPTVRLASSFGDNPNAKPAPVEDASAPTQKLSDLFRLQNVSMTNGRFEYDLSAKGRQLPPVIWDHLNVTINTHPTDVSGYQFSLSLNDQPLSTMKADGAFDIDSLVLDLEHLSVDADCDSKQQAEQLPPVVQEAIRKFQIGGRIALDAKAHLPLKTIDQGNFDATLTLKNGQCKPPGWAEPIKPAESVLICSNHGNRYDFKFTAGEERLASLQTTGSFDGNSSLLNLDQIGLTVNCDAENPTAQLPQKLVDLLAKNKVGGVIAVDGMARVPLQSPLRGLYAAHFSLKNGHCQPQDWKGPVTLDGLKFAVSNLPERSPKSLPINLPDQPAESHLWLDALSGDCGKQNLKIEDGSEVTFNPNDKSWSLRRFHGTIDVGNGPGPLDGANVRIWLPFIASGNGTLGDNTSSIRVALDSGAARVTPSHILIDQINGMLTVTPVGLTSSGLKAICAHGQIKLAANLDWQSASALAYNGEINISKVDLHQLAIQYTQDQTVRQRAFGELDFNSRYQGMVPAGGPTSGADSPVDRLTAQGDVDINHGYFMDIPVLKDVLGAMNNPNAATLGEAAATFDIAHQVVNFTQMAVSSPAIGVQGSGTLAFDQSLNMTFVATPLSDWSKDLKGSDVSFLRDLSGIAGQAQNLVNKAQSLVLYQFRATGTVSKPEVKAVPVPALADRVGPLFEKMSGDHSEGSMSEELKKQQSESK